MSLNHFKPQVWSSDIIRTLEKDLVATRICNRNYQGDVRFGNQVKVQGINAVTVNSYTINGSITWQNGEDSQSLINIDQQKYFAVSIDNVDEVQANANIMGAYTQEAAYQLGDTLDSYVLNLVTTAGIKNSSLGTTTTAIEITADGGAGSKASNFLSIMARYMSDNNVPKNGRYVVVPPWFIQKLIIEKVVSGGSVDANQEYNNGYITRAYGFDIFESNNCKITSSTKYHLLAGVQMSLTLAEQIVQMKAVDRQDTFAEGIKGLHVYGAKVIRPDATLEAVVTEGAEGQ